MKTNKFPKTKRLNKSADFKEVLNAPQERSSDCNFTVLGHFYCRDNPKLKLGIIVAKKRIKLAVRRNRIKRIVREAFRNMEEDKFKQGLNLVVIAKEKADFSTNSELFLSLRKHFQKFIKNCD